MKFFKLNDETEIHYEVIPNVLAEHTVFIHGNLASNRWWYPAEEAWKRKAQGARPAGSMILVEFRGCGKTTPPKHQDDVSMKKMAQDFIGLVKDLNLGPVNLVGHSTGGLIAALMMEQAPQLFKKSVLLDPVGATGVQFHPSMDEAFEQMKTNKDLVAVVMGSTIHENKPETDFFRQIVVEDAFHAVNTVGSMVLKALHNLDIQEECRKIGHPTLVLHGEHDQLLPRKDSEGLAGLLPNGQFAVIPGRGHCANVENPAQFVNIVDEFLFA